MKKRMICDKCLSVFDQDATYCKYCGKRMEAKRECDCQEAQKAFRSETIKKESNSPAKAKKQSSGNCGRLCFSDRFEYWFRLACSL